MWAIHKECPIISLDSAAITALCAQTLTEAKAEDVITIDLKGRTALADAMIVASGTSARHIVSLGQRLEEVLKAKGVKGLRLEGLGGGDWVLLDAGDVIVHLMRPEVREFYALESLWSADTLKRP